MKRFSKVSPILQLAALLSILLTFPGLTEAQNVPSKLYSSLKWRLIGPFRAGRVLAVSGIAGEPNVYYFGSVGGGVWKSNNAGRVWKPLFDRQPVASIGAVALAPSDPQVIYAGSGEADMRSDISFGDGVYKSIDGGRTWKNVGLKDSRHIGRILVDPSNSDIVLAAALGHAYGANTMRGVFRSSDGGAVWHKVLYKDENTGAVDLAFDPENSRTVYASLWRTRRPPWSTYPPGGGSGSGLYKSSDGGLSWTHLTGHGLPSQGLGRIGIAVARGEGGRIVYALIDARQGGLYRSDDWGKTWRRVGVDPRIRGRAWYFSRVFVDPQDADTVYVGNVALYRSIDGGKAFQVIKGAPGGDDYHFLWIDPGDSKRMIVGSDQGVAISLDGGDTWGTFYNQPTAQFYHVATDNQFPYHVYGAQQDSGSVAVESRSDYGSITYRNWRSVGGGESGYIVPDPLDVHIVYGGDTYGRLYRFNGKSHQRQDISPWPAARFGADIAQAKYRFTWTSPLVFSPQDPHTIYFGAQVLLTSTDRGMSWQAISPDLTRGGPSRAVPGNSSDEVQMEGRGRGVIYSIAPSPLQEGQIWAGSDDGLIHLTRDGGKHWQNVTPSGLRPWSKISILSASPFDAGTAYAAVDRHRVDDYKPYIYRTYDFGQSWKQISSGIREPAFVRVVRADPKRKGLLFAGTETGVYFSIDDGDHWQSLQLNLPTSPIRDLVVHGDDLVTATHGRSFWILDNISPLRQIGPEVEKAEVYLFPPAPAFRVRKNINPDTPLAPEEAAGTNPPSGAIIDYYLGSAQSAEIHLEIRDSSGKRLRSFSSGDRGKTGPSLPVPTFPHFWLRSSPHVSDSAGMHRFVWNLRLPPPRSVEFRYGIAAAVTQGTPLLPQGPRVLPGEYRITLRANNRTYSRTLTVRRDPRVETSLEDLSKQFELESKISDGMRSSFQALQEIRSVRSQLEALQQRLRGDSRWKAVLENAAALDRKASRIGGSGEPSSPPRGNLTESNRRLAALMNVVDSGDFAPTRQAQAAFLQMQRSVERELTEWENLKKKELTALNRLIQRGKIPALFVSPLSAAKSAAKDRE